MKIRTATVYTLKVVERGHVHKWMDYEIEKQKEVYDDNGETKTYYALYIDGDFEAEFKTLKEARQYIIEEAFGEAVNAESAALHRLCDAIVEFTDGRIQSHTALRMVMNKREALKEIASCM